MGGGPASADVVRASCLLTFPEDTMVEPVPVDAWYLHAVGLTFLRRLARDRVGDEPRLALLLQSIDDAVSPPRRRYISVSSDAVLRDALRATFARPERVLVLHLIALEKVRGQKSIHVTPEINPNVSPEPIAPLAMVFPTLAVDAAQPVSAAMALSSSFRLSRSVFDFDKPLATASKQLSHSDSWLDRSQEFGYTGKRVDDSPSSSPSPSPSPSTAAAATEQEFEDDAPFALAAAGAQLIADRQRSDGSDVVQKPSPSTAKEDSGIPMARVVGRAVESDAPRIPSDYVMLELQHGAGLNDVATAMPATSASTFFISPTWHLHAEELSASARLRAAEAHAEGEREATVAVARPIREWSGLSPVTSTTTTTTTTTASSSSSLSSGGISMEDSFVMLDHTAAANEPPTRRRIL